MPNFLRHQYREAGGNAIALLGGVFTNFAKVKIFAAVQKRSAGGAAFPHRICVFWSNQPAAAAGTSRWRFMTILLSAPR